MSELTLPLLTGEDLVQLLADGKPAEGCPICKTLVCPGWESMPGSFDATNLRPVGTLRRAEDEDPTLTEYHPNGTNAWSPDAPVAPVFYPYNRCGVWQCVGCARTFLRYTEYGGYYVDERIRAVDAALIVTAPA